MEPGMVQQNVNNKQEQCHTTSRCGKGQLCICCKYPTPVILEKMMPYLERYPRKKDAAILIEGFKFGFKLAYGGDRAQRDSGNLKSITNLKTQAFEKLNKEVKLGRIAGPFESRPIPNLIVSPIGLVPKSEPGKYRLIQHLSFPEGTSINDGIDRDMCKVQYTSFDVAVGLVVAAGKGALMAKADIESAFRLLPVHPSDFQLLGIQLDGQFFVDKALPMGASCSPAHFERFSTFLEWVTMETTHSSSMCHYIDDVFVCGMKGDRGPQSCIALLDGFRKICRKFGVPLAEEKTVGPTTKIVFLGLQIDSIEQTVSIPQNKLVSVKAKVQHALQSEKLTLREIQSLIGSLQFVCKAVSPGRAFLRRLIGLTCGVTSPHVKLTITNGAKCDLRMWLVFLESFNGVSIIPDQFWFGSEDLSLFTDACKTVGFAGYFEGKWFNGRWPEGVSSSSSIAWLEFFPVVAAIALWGHMLKGKRIILRSDNQTVVSIINKQTSRCSKIMKLVRFFVLQCIKNNVAFCSRHVPGKINIIADALSRFQMERFREAAPAADAHPAIVPQFLWKL